MSEAAVSGAGDAEEGPVIGDVFDGLFDFTSEPAIFGCCRRDIDDFLVFEGF